MSDEFDEITNPANVKARTDDLDRHNHAMAGHETGDGSAHYSLKQAALDITSPDTSNRSKHKQQSGKDLWRIILDNQLADLQSLIGGCEYDFAKEHGEAWREELALEILEPDMIPQRRDGESMEDYRARVEKALMDELLNEDGTIKDKYKDHPKYSQYAQWAQWKHDQQQAKAFEASMNDPSLSDAEREKLVEDYMRSATYERLRQSLASASPSLTEEALLIAKKDGIEDAKGTTAAALTENSFMR